MNAAPRKLCPNGCGEPGPHYCPPSMGEPGFYTRTPLKGANAPRVRDRDMELATAPMHPQVEAMMVPVTARLKDQPPRIVSIGNPDSPQDFQRRMQDAGRAGLAAGIGIGFPTYPTFEEPRDPGVMDPRDPAATPFHRPDAVRIVDDLFGDELGDLSYRDATSPSAAARAKARKRRKRRR